ncbi:MAG: HAMP domain-containing protein [Desulfovibrio sp.]|nr:MAG: HAMP domain-containing protein [Desulfovibrio sp.]
MPTPSDAIKVSSIDAKSRRRRQRYIIIAVVALVLVVALFWVEISFLNLRSYSFLALVNLNFILLLVALLVVVRNGVKLLIDRRRKVLGAKLRSKLVLAFMSLSLIPTVIMFLVSMNLVHKLVDYWFTSQVESAMEQVLEVGQEFTAMSQERLQQRAESLLIQIEDQGVAWDDPEMSRFFAHKREEYGMSMLMLVGPDLDERIRQMTERFHEAWPEMKEKINWESLRERPRFWSVLWAGSGSDFVIGVLPIAEGEEGYLVLGERIGSGLTFRLDQIARGVEEYKQYKIHSQPFKMALLFIIGLLAMLVVLGAIWFGFQLARELSAPIQALAEGTERIARGDLAVRLEDQSTDEFGVLVRSFNKMAQDLEQSRTGLTRANERLAGQNLELERRGRYMEAVLDNITAGVVSLDSEGRISTWNKAAAEILSMDGEMAVGRKPESLLSEEYAELMDQVLVQLASKPGAKWERQLDMQIGSHTGKLLVNVVSLTTRDGDNPGAVAVFEDITELEKMQRLAAWQEVARRIAHEIKNPLTPIKLSAQRLERRYAASVADEVFTECTALIVRQVEHLQQMVGEFSAFAKLPEIAPVLGRLEPLLEEVVALFRMSHSHIEWELAASEGLPEIPFDREAVRRAMINILTNAAEALDGKAKGRVKVSTDHVPEKGVVRIEIADNGPGLTPEERSRLFEPYFSRKKGGTGLGLAIVKSIVADHRGSVRAGLSSDEGTVLVVELPLS